MSLVFGPEEELEAALWSALTRHKVTVDHAQDLMADLVAAAVAYATCDSDALTAARRMVLHEAITPGPDRPQPVDNPPVERL